ncbi:MAG TPA: type II toxin-antitoxin system HigB family toxin [Hymenobacter sp.]
MNVWHHKTKLANWAILNELRAEVSDKDYITNDRYVFNVGSFRIVAMIFFKAQQLYIRGIFTHKEYDKRRAQLPIL